MNIFNDHGIHLFLRVTDKRIILILIISLTSGIGATRFKDYKQQWTLTGKNPNWKVKYDTTIDTANMAPDAEHEIVNVLEEYKSKGRGADMKIRQNNRHSYSEIVDKAGECRNVSGIRKSEVEVSMEERLRGGNIAGYFSGTGERQVDKMFTGHVVLATEVSGDEAKGQESKEEESTRARSVTELFQQEISEMGTYFTELLGERGKVN
jgi:hypothetical protein